MEWCAATFEFGGQGIRIGHIEVGIPLDRGIARGVRLRGGFARLDEEVRAVAGDDGEEGLLVRLPVLRLETSLSR